MRIVVESAKRTHAESRIGDYGLLYRSWDFVIELARIPYRKNNLALELWLPFASLVGGGFSVLFDYRKDVVYGLK